MAARRRNRVPSLKEAAERLAYAKRFGIEPDGESRKRIRDTPCLPEVHRQLARYRVDSVLWGLCQADPRLSLPQLADYQRARFASEAAVACGETGKEADVEALLQLMHDCVHVIDPAGLEKSGGPAVHVMARLTALQFMVQGNPHSGLHRSLGSLVSDDPDSPISQEAWREVLGGLSLVEFTVGIEVATLLLSSFGVLDFTSLQEQLAQYPDVLALLALARDALRLVAADITDFREAATSRFKSDELNAVGRVDPMLATPAIAFADRVIGSPSPRYVQLAASPAALYIRLIRADKGSELRSSAAGEQFAHHMQSWTRAQLPTTWDVVDLDVQFNERKRADLLVVSKKRSLAFLIELKSTLQKKESILGDADALAKMTEVYEGAFEQIEASPALLAGSAELAGLIEGCELFGLVVTLELHQHTVQDGATHVGVSLPWRIEGEAGIRIAAPPTRLMQANDFEIMLSALAESPPEAAKPYVDAVFASGSTMRAPLRLLDVLGLDPDKMSDELNEYEVEIIRSSGFNDLMPSPQELKRLKEL